MPWRIAIVVALMLSFLGVAIPKAAEAQSGTATLTIHSRFCPPGYDGTDIFADCHGNPGLLAIEYSANRFTDSPSAMPDSDGFRKAVPDAEGNITFEDLPSGSYHVESNLPAEGQHPAIYCSPGDGSEPTYYAAGASRERYASIETYDFEITLIEGDSITCDWYTLPDSDLLGETANLVIHNRFCPVGYNGSDEFADCHGNIGIAYVDYSMTGANTQNAMMVVDGNVYFHWLQPGTDDVRFDFDAFDLPASISCSTYGTGEQPFLVQSIGTGEPLTLDLAAGETVICDWYIYPSADYYQTTSPFFIDAVMCPSDPGSFAYGSLPEQCSAASGVRVVVYPDAGGMDFAVDCVTSTDGRCRVDTPRQVPLTVEIDTSSLPNGYLPIANPVNTVSFTEYANARFILIPAAVDKGD